MNRVIIGLSGKKGAGKDTVGKSLAESLGEFNTIVTSFGKALYKEVSYTYDVPISVLQDRTFKENIWAFFNPFKTGFRNWFKYIGYAKSMSFKTPREVLQWYGTDYVRNTICESYWVDKVLAEIEASPECNFIITDVRFPSEVLAISSVGGYNARIVRDESIRSAKYDTIASTSTHSSETSLDKEDIKEYLNKELDMYSASDEILEDVRNKQRAVLGIK